MYSLREEIDRGKWVVQGDWIFLNHWTTPLPVGASLLATSRAHRSWPKRLRHLWASSAGCPRDPATTGLMKREVPRDTLDLRVVLSILYGPSLSVIDTRVYMTCRWLIAPPPGDFSVRLAGGVPFGEGPLGFFAFLGGSCSFLSPLQATLPVRLVGGAPVRKEPLDSGAGSRHVLWVL